MSKHTEGPWTADSGWIRASTEGVGAIAELRCREYTQHDKADPTRDEYAANARLIAAAPEMLAALKLAAWTFLNRDGFTEDERYAAVASARAAIAAAEGRADR